MTGRVDPPPRSWTSLRLDPEAIRTLAHPLRSRLLTALRESGPATATVLAGQLATNTGATSYHLRKLAAVGLVEETDQGRGRERWWQASTQMHSWTDEDAGEDPDAQTAAQWLRSHYLRLFLERAEDWLEHHDSWPLAWRRLAGQSDYTMSMTTTQLEALLRELWEVVDRHHGSADEANAHLADDDAARAALPVRERPEKVTLYLWDFPVGEHTTTDGHPDQSRDR